MNDALPAARLEERGKKASKKTKLYLPSLAAANGKGLKSLPISEGRTERRLFKIKHNWC